MVLYHLCLSSKRSVVDVEVDVVFVVVVSNKVFVVDDVVDEDDVAGVVDHAVVVIFELTLENT